MSHYIHGFSESERRRLTLMQGILNRAQLREMDLTGVRAILDVGCGLGQLTREMASAAGAGTRVVGVERSAVQRAEAERQAAEAGEQGRVEFRAGDAERLPLTDDERGSFDLVHARFLLEHVPDPAAVVREMVSAARPGGRVVLVDDDHELLRLWPDCPAADGLWRPFWESYRDHGFDPLVGRTLPGLLHGAGAVAIRVTTVFYGATRGQSLFDAVVDNLIEVMRSAEEDLDRSGRLPRDEMRAGIDAIHEWRRGEAATVWYSIPLAEGKRPG